MRNQVPFLLVLLLAGFALVGCGASEDKSNVESPQAKANAEGEAAKWTPEQKEIYKKAMMGHAKTFGDNGGKSTK